MKTLNFSKYDHVILISIPPSAFMVYAYLLLIENRRTRTCHPSYSTIAAATGISRNTVMKSIGILAEKALITAEASRYFDERGMKWNGNNLYTVLPIQCAVDKYHQRQLYQLEETLERQRVQAHLSRPVSRCMPAEGIGWDGSTQQKVKEGATASMSDVRRL